MVLTIKRRSPKFLIRRFDVLDANNIIWIERVIGSEGVRRIHCKRYYVSEWHDVSAAGGMLAEQWDARAMNKFPQFYQIHSTLIIRLSHRS